MIKVPIQLAHALLAYLDTRPHGEVRGLIDALQSCQQAEPEPPKGGETGAQDAS